MILQGKAKDFFIKWLCYGNDGNSNILRSTKLTTANFIALKESCQNALIIEWFDSVGIYISDWGLNVVDNEIGFDCQINYNFKLISVSDNFFKTRQEAIEKAIEKANEIYNNLNL